jgi:hypothetical protein
MTTTDKILKRHDKGEHVAEIAAALDVTAGYVYGILREHRPKRRRKPRRSTSDNPRMIAGLFKQDIPPGRIAVVLGVSRAFVYAELARQGLR